MRNLLIASLLIASGTFVLAQSTARTEEYCEFVLGRAPGLANHSILLDIGQEGVGVERLRDESGEIVIVNSAIDALNYLNGFGWELISARGENSLSAYYTMRRKMKDKSANSTPPNRENINGVHSSSDKSSLEQRDTLLLKRMR